MSPTSTVKPTYLGLLNTVSLAETRAHCYLTEWAGVTDNEEVRQVLLTVAAREGEHGMSFAKRINELGYQLRDKPDDRSEKALEIVRAECSDIEKFEALGLHKLDTGDEPDVFDNLFKDHSIDIRTGEMLGRYIAEERDSARLFRSCYEQLCAARDAKRRKNGKRPSAEKASADKEGADPKGAKQMAGLERKVDALTRAVEELRQIVCAQSMPADAG